MNSLLPKTEGNTVSFLGQIMNSRTPRQRPTKPKSKLFFTQDAAGV